MGSPGKIASGKNENRQKLAFNPVTGKLELHGPVNNYNPDQGLYIYRGVICGITPEELLKSGWQKLKNEGLNSIVIHFAETHDLKSFKLFLFHNRINLAILCHCFDAKLKLMEQPSPRYTALDK